MEATPVQKGPCFPPYLWPGLLYSGLPGYCILQAFKGPQRLIFTEPLSGLLCEPYRNATYTLNPLHVRRTTHPKQVPADFGDAQWHQLLVVFVGCYRSLSTRSLSGGRGTWEGPLNPIKLKSIFTSDTQFKVFNSKSSAFIVCQLSLSLTVDNRASLVPLFSASGV